MDQKVSNSRVRGGRDEHYLATEVRGEAATTASRFKHFVSRSPFLYTGLFFVNNFFTTIISNVHVQHVRASALRAARATALGGPVSATSER